MAERPAPVGEDPDYKALWESVSETSRRRQQMLNDLGICDDCGQIFAEHDSADVAGGTCRECGQPIGCVSTCCWTGPESIWLHDDPPADDHTAEPTPADEERAHAAAVGPGGDHVDPAGRLRSQVRRYGDLSATLVRLAGESRG